MEDSALGPADGVWPPEETALLTGAFRESWRFLAFAFDNDRDVDATIVRNRIARSLLDSRLRGIRSHGALITQALASLEPVAAKWASD